MRIKYVSQLLLGLSCVTTCALMAMEETSLSRRLQKLKPYSPIPIMQIPDELYKNVNQGTLKNWSHQRVELLKKSVGTITKRMTIRAPEKDREQYDYVHALNHVQNNLLAKPTKNLTVEDIKKLNACLTRLTDNNPGKFRNQGRFWWVDTVTNVEYAELIVRFTKLNPSRPATEDLLEDFAKQDTLCREKTHVFPEAKDIEPLLQSFLDTLKNEQGLHPVEMAARLHFGIVNIHPFDNASKRTGRVLANKVLMEHGYKPVIVTNGEEYKKAMMDSIHKNDENKFIAYFAKLVEQQQNN